MAQIEQAETMARGTRQDNGALHGTLLLQSAREWEARNNELAGALRDRLRRSLIRQTGRALDIGCMAGELTDRYGEGLALSWSGIDPDIDQPTRSKGGAELLHGFGHRLAFASDTFDCVTLANVYEHIPPALRAATLAEIHRVLAPGGILVGQLPNPRFPIESHSRLPFLGWLPRALQRIYWNLTPTGWDFDKAHFFSVTMPDLRKAAIAAGFEVVDIVDFNYSPAAIPKKLRWAARVHAGLGIFPWSWQFVLRKPQPLASTGARGRTVPVAGEAQASVTPALCREIRVEDFPQIIDLLVAGRFKDRPRHYWEMVRDRLIAHPAPSPYPRFGFLLEVEGRVVGLIFSIFTSFGAGLEPGVRACTSSWYVDPAYRGRGFRLAREVTKFKEVTYLNPTPGDDTHGVMHLLKYKTLSKGHFLSLPWLNRGARGAKVRAFASASDFAGRLTVQDIQILTTHRDYGCLSLVCEIGDRAYPFVFLRRLSPRGLPYAQVIYCREPAILLKCAGPVGRYLALRGMLFLAMDCNGPIRGLIGTYMANRVRFYRGPTRPHWGDLAYSELALFGD